MRSGYERVRCTECGRPREEAGPISTRGKCGHCATMLVVENDAGIMAGIGPAFQRWRIGMAAAVLPAELVAVMFREGIFTDDGVAS